MHRPCFEADEDQVLMICALWLGQSIKIGVGDTVHRTALCVYYEVFLALAFSQRKNHFPADVAYIIASMLYLHIVPTFHPLFRQWPLEEVPCYDKIWVAFNRDINRIRDGVGERSTEIGSCRLRLLACMVPG